MYVATDRCSVSPNRRVHTYPIPEIRNQPNSKSIQPCIIIHIRRNPNIPTVSFFRPSLVGVISIFDMTWTCDDFESVVQVWCVYLRHLLGLGAFIDNTAWYPKRWGEDKLWNVGEEPARRSFLVERNDSTNERTNGICFPSVTWD